MPLARGGGLGQGCLIALLGVGVAMVSCYGILVGDNPSSPRTANVEAGASAAPQTTLPPFNVELTRDLQDFFRTHPDVAEWAPDVRNARVVGDRAEAMSPTREAALGICAGLSLFASTNSLNQVVVYDMQRTILIFRTTDTRPGHYRSCTQPLPPPVSPGAPIQATASTTPPTGIRRVHADDIVALARTVGLQCRPPQAGPQELVHTCLVERPQSHYRLEVYSARDGRTRNLVLTLQSIDGSSLPVDGHRRFTWPLSLLYSSAQDVDLVARWVETNYTTVRMGRLAEASLGGINLQVTGDDRFLFRSFIAYAPEDDPLSPPLATAASPTTPAVTQPASPDGSDEVCGHPAGATSRGVVVDVADDDVLNIREGPGVEHRIIAAVHNGNALNVIAGSDVPVGRSTWVQVQIPAELVTQDSPDCGWVNSQYIAR